MAQDLKTELETYDRNKETLLGSARDQYVLIKGDRIVGTFASQEDALKRGYEEFGKEPFLVKRVTENEVPLNFATFAIAL